MTEPVPTVGTAPDPAPPPDAPRRRGNPALQALVTVLVLAVAGVLAGVVWWQVVDPVQVTRTAQGTGIGELQLSRQFGYDGWYLLIAALPALLVGLVRTARAADATVTVVALVVGGAVAAALMAVTGHLLGPADPSTVLADAAVGTTAPAQLSVQAHAVYLTWPVAALLGSMLVLLGPGSAPRD